MPLHSYRAFGLNIASEFELPMLPVGRFGEADVTIELGPTPRALPALVFETLLSQTSEQEYLLHPPNIARYWSSSGRRIVVEPTGGNAEAIALFLLGSVFASILHQRKTLVLHGSAVAIGGRAVLFLGKAGAGKSTIATAFRQRGIRGLSDDLTPVRFEAGIPHAVPAFPNSKLWPDSLAGLNIDSRQLPRVRADLEKRSLGWEDQFEPLPLPLGQIYLLGNHQVDSPELLDLQPIERLAALKANTFRQQFLELPGIMKAHFASLAEIARSVRVTALKRQTSPFDVMSMVDSVLQHLAR